MRKKILGVSLKSFLWLLAGSLLGVILLTAIFCIPVNLQNAQKSYELFDREGWYPVMPYASRELDTYFHSFLPGVLDGATDSIMIYTATDDSVGNPLQRAMNMYVANIDMNYSYYWHGYVIVLRPLLLFFDYWQIRVLNGFGQVGLVIFLCAWLMQNKGKSYAAAMFTTYALLMPMAMAFSLQFSWVFYIAGISCMILFKREKFFEQKDRWVYLFLTIGMLTSFFDLLTYPLFTWGIPMIWWIAIDDQNKTSRQYIIRVVLSGISWIAGYGGMWSLKWVYATFILHRDVIGDALDEVLLRSGAGEGTWTLSDRLQALYMNWKHYEDEIYLLILVAWLLCSVLCILKWELDKNSKSPAFLLVGTSSAVWYFVLANHTSGHHFFTYRIWSISISAFVVMQAEKMQCRKSYSKDVMWKKIFCKSCVLVGMAILAIGLSRFAREDVKAVNGGAPVKQILLEENAVVETDFTPTFSHITEYAFGMSSASTQGEYRIALFEDGNLLYEEHSLIKDDNMNDYHVLAVDWRLQSGKRYLIRISPQQNNAPVFAVVTEVEMPLIEYGNALVNSTACSGQILSGIQYNALPQSKRTMLIIIIAWFGILMSAGETCHTFFEERKRHIE